ncbi:HalOD1 output domain-containing protein [Haloarcula pelagica]|uniref:HalOD1 output domain-containing protein n=1 Tax=Haloarcula pelagica TaxID=3033389 RepID=UPI0024C35BA1|nr:HalOD1 output domain-containing protein [Halomicroarcula sp. YJ-61-S]
MTAPNGTTERRRGYDPATGTYHTHHDWSGSTPLHYTVCTAVAALTGDDVSTTTPLADVVEPDALETLFRPEQPTGAATDRATFTYGGCTVTIYRDGRIHIVP